MIPNKKLTTEKEMPMIGLGTWQVEGAICERIVRTAIDIGYTHIDTAEMYGNEEEIGKVLDAQLRKKLFLTSKVWKDNLTKDGVITACQQSLAKLKTDYLDLYLIHWPNKDADMDDVLEGFKYLLEKEKIKAMGVSNFTINHLKEILPLAKQKGLTITVNQVEYHPGLNQEELLEFCKKNDIAVTAYSPLGSGDIPGLEILKEIAQKHTKTPQQIALRWLTQKGIIAIPRTTSKEHAEQNMNVFDFKLTPEEIQKIDDLGNDQRKIAPGFAEFDKE